MNAELLIKNLKKEILKASNEAKDGHIASSFSILDILYVLYYKFLDIKIDVPIYERDIFVLSKGHASLGLYSILASLNFFKMSELSNFCKKNSFLGGHPDSLKVPGVDASTGSLGHGLPIAVGMAWSQKLLNSDFKTVCLIGDGEANEGTIWESLLVAAHNKLNNLYCIIDYNHSSDRAVNLGSLESKFLSFGFEVEKVDGHDVHKLEKTLNNFNNKKKPKAIIANTVKGKGILSMENNPEWHHKYPNEEQLKHFLEELSRN